MTKRLSLFLATVAAIAFAVPANASAAPAVTDGSGKLLSTGTLITSTSSHFVVETNLGDITCELAEFDWEVTKNTGSSVTGAGKGQGTLDNCKLGSSKVTGRDLTVTELKSVVSSKGEIKMTFELVFPNLELECHFTGFLGWVPFSYVASSDEMSLVDADFAATPETCEPGIVNADFTLERTAGGAVILD